MERRLTRAPTVSPPRTVAQLVHFDNGRYISAMQPDETITVEDAVQVLAMVGDLSMGLPPDHSIRTARLAARLAEENGDGLDACTSTRLVALLRWSGSTATAAGFAHLLGDDVGGRLAMVTRTLTDAGFLTMHNVLPLARMQCEVAG